MRLVSRLGAGLCFAFLMLFFSRCTALPPETPPPTADPLALDPVSGFAVLPSPTVTMPPIPTRPPATPTPGPAISPTLSLSQSHLSRLDDLPSAFSTLTMADLRRRPYPPGGQIERLAQLTVTEAYTRYSIAYPSDDLTITGVLHLPHGPGPFPVVILNHGYIPPAEYWSGADTWRAADYLAQRGYLTLAPDFRCWGGSDKPAGYCGVFVETWPAYQRAGPSIDVLNLIAALPSLPQADPARLVMWGHSMGGGITLRAMLINPQIKGGVLYAPVSAKDADFLTRYPSPYPHDPQFYEQVSPWYHLDWLTAPVQLHNGTRDQITPARWAEDTHHRLLNLGKDSTLFIYPNAGHAFAGSDWELFMERTVDFFEAVMEE